MNDVQPIVREDRCPAMSYTEMLEADTRRVPDYLFEESDVDLPTGPIAIEPYVSADFARLERERMWPNVWLFAARDDEMPDPGDTVVFEINDRSFLLVRQENGSVRAFYNVCLHRGRKLRTKSGRTTQLRCGFHGFTWNNDGSLKEIPCAWDFKHLEGKDMRLPEARVSRWQGFVMITENQSIPDFKEWVGPVLDQYEAYDFENRYTGMWVARKVAANWKATTDARNEKWDAEDKEWEDG